MRYACLTCDFDGTLARDGVVMLSTLEALAKVRSSDRKLILSTGRQLDDLRGVFPEFALFHRIVAENGAVLYRPASKELVRLAEPPKQSLTEELRRRGVQPLSVGECIVATRHPHEKVVLEVIRDLNLGLQIIFNKGAVMVLPSGANKGVGLEMALGELALSLHNVVGVGDAENDHAFLSICECSVAVRNALPAIKEGADWVTSRSHGEGVEELIELLLENDLEELAPRLKRHDILLGTLADGKPFTVPVCCSGLLVAGPSGTGKSTIVSAIVERLVSNKYQVCLFDPEGDYDEFKPLIRLGGPEHMPASTEVLNALANPSQSVSINLLGVPLADRPSSFRSLFAHVQELRSQTARPHWMVVDEAHHLLPAEFPSVNSPQNLYNAIFATVHPDAMSPEVLKTLAGIIVTGNGPQQVIDQFSLATKQRLDQLKMPHPGSGEVLAWLFSDLAGPRYVSVKLADRQLRRHRRKYAAGELGEDKSFYFRGPQGRLNLRAQNMNMFVQLAEGLDDGTWTFHLSRGDYSRWLSEKVKDKDLAEIVAGIENSHGLTASESRQQVIEAVRSHYTAPA